MKALRLVLDTNVWLDWLVFGDPAVAPIKVAHAAGAVEVFIDTPCARELDAVLARESTKKPADADCRGDWRRIVRFWKQAIRSAAQSPDCADPQAQPPLPACRDREDQKFLELARDCRADFLVTRDRELLALARRKQRTLPFRVVTPQQIASELIAG